MNDKNVWIILNTTTRSQSAPLSDEQLQLTVMRLSINELERYYLWKNTWEAWQPLMLLIKGDYKNLLNFVSVATTTRSKHASKENPGPELSSRASRDAATEVRDEADDFFSENFENQGQLDMDEMKIGDVQQPRDISFQKLARREEHLDRASRHELKIELILISPSGKSFRSFSKNISLSGSLVEDNVPFEYYGKVFELVVINRFAQDKTHARVQLRGKTIGDGVSRRIKFEKMNDRSLVSLKALLDEYLKNQKEISKKAA